MPLHDFQCPLCRHSFEAVVAIDASEAPCPRCLTVAGRAGASGLPPVTPRQSVLAEARALGVTHGRRAADGDDLERYARQYGSAAAVDLIHDTWGPRYPPYQLLQQRSEELAAGAWTAVEDDVFAAFAAGFVAACGDVYDDSALDDEPSSS